MNKESTVNGTNGNAATRVSVIIPTHNRKKWIGECLDSVLGQSYTNVEIIVVDDQSTDDTVDWLRSQKKYENVVVHVQEVNGGASIARNKGIEMAKGNLIAFIDSDDTLMPDHIEKAAAAFEIDPELGLFACDSKMIDVDGNVILGGRTWHENLAEYRGIEVETGYRTLESVFQYSNCFPGFTLRREVFDELGGFDQSIFPADDYDLALRVAESKWKVFYLHEPLCLRREHDGQCSGIVNSVKTQVQLIKALKNAVERNQDVLAGRKQTSERVANLKMELALSKLKDGQKSAGLRSLIDSLIRSPKEFKTIAKIGQRRIRKAIGPS